MQNQTKIENLLRKAEDEVNHAKKELGKTRASRFKEIYESYSNNFPKLHEKPGWQAMLVRLCKLQIEIENIEAEIELAWNLDTNGRQEYFKYVGKLLKLVQLWNLILTRMGMTFTASPYIAVKDREVKAPSEIVQMQEKIKKIAETMQKERKRLNKTGRREAKHENLAENAERREKEAEQEAETQ